MGKSEGKMKSLALIRVILFFTFLALSSWVFLSAMNTSYQPAVLSLLSLAMLIFALGNVLKSEVLAIAAWILPAFLSVAVQILLSNTATYLSALALATLMFVLLDLVHYICLVYPTHVWRGGMTVEQYARIWSLVKKHFFFILILSLLSYVASLTVTSLFLSLSPIINPVLGVAAFASAALLLIAGLAFEKRV